MRLRRTAGISLVLLAVAVGGAGAAGPGGPSGPSSAGRRTDMTALVHRLLATRQPAFMSMSR